MSAAHERTEEATPRRRARAAAKGQTVRSSAALSACALASAAIPVAVAFDPHVWVAQLRAAAAGAAMLGASSDSTTLVNVLEAATLHGPAPSVVAAAGVGSLLAAACAAVASGAWAVAPGALRPSLARLSPLVGLRRIASADGLAQAAAAFAAICAVGWATCLAARASVAAVPLDVSLAAAAHVLAAAVRELWWRVTLCAVAFAVADVWWQRRRFATSLRMTPREVRDERAELEGKPEVRARRRAVAGRRARGLRLRAIARATAVVANPTHVAVALRYAPPAIEVPLVVARGADLAAGLVRGAAEQSGVPIIESPELARALYGRVDVDEPIPEDCYAAVAAIFAWIIRTRGALRTGDDA